MYIKVCEYVIIKKCCVFARMLRKFRTQRFKLHYMNMTATTGKKTLILILTATVLFFSFSQLLSLWMDIKIKNVLLHQNRLYNLVQTEDVSAFEQPLDFTNTIETKDDSLFQHLVRLTYTEKNDVSTFDQKLQKLIPCYDRLLESAIHQHGNFWVLSNYVRAEQQHRCFESVTYTTQGDFTFLDNLIPIVERWKGPISVAIHAPGTDFQPTLDSIAYLRNCKDSLITQYVTFHLLFDMEHMPRKPSNKSFDVPLWKLYKDEYNCSKGAPYANVKYMDLYKINANITYPINVARNVARENAQTHFVLASDIELYPSPNLIKKFLHMIVKKPYLFEEESPMIFVLPVFEVEENETVPENKKALQEMIQTNRSFSFHKHICNRCHAIPQLEEWLNLSTTEELDIFLTTKRQGKQVRWEAVYIGTNEDPFFDERLDWERHGNKMSQAYALCLLDYDYKILDNAFLVHKPGIKEKMVNAEVIPHTAKYISNYLGVQLDIIYGKRKGCKA